MESVRLLTEWENLAKIGGYPKSQRTKVEITPASCRLKNSIRTPKSYHIIRRVDRQLLNERFRSINQTLYLYKLKIEMCYTRLKNIRQDREVLQKCSSLIYKGKEFYTATLN